MMPLVDTAQRLGSESGTRISYVTGTIASQLFGIPIGRVHDVFSVGAITPVPLAPQEIVGVMNLRGRVVTAIDLRHRLGLASLRPEPGTMAIGIEAGSDAFGLLVERIGEIVTVDSESFEDSPIHLDASWAELSRGVHRLEGELLVVLDVDALLEITPATDIQRASETPS